jgi:hypothetical protein
MQLMGSNIGSAADEDEDTVEPSLTMRIASPEGYTTIGRVKGADERLPDQVAKLLEDASENVRGPVPGIAHVRRLVERMRTAGARSC